MCVTKHCCPKYKSAIQLSIEYFYFQHQVVVLLYNVNGIPECCREGSTHVITSSYPARSLKHFEVERIASDVAFNDRQRMTCRHGYYYRTVTVQINDRLDFLLKTTNTHKHTHTQPALVTGFKQPSQVNVFITLNMLPFIPLHFLCTHF